MSKTTPVFSLNSFTMASGDWYKNVSYEDAKNLIKEKMLSSAESFVSIGYYLKHISETGQYKEGGYGSIWECAENEFGFSQAKASRCINICKTYSADGDSPFLDERFKSFNISQLQEMLPIKDERLIEQITPDMSVKEIRDIRSVKKAEDASEAAGNEILPGQMQIETIEGDFREFGSASDNEGDQAVDPESLSPQEASDEDDSSLLKEKQSSDSMEPTDADIRAFYKSCIKGQYDCNRDDLKNKLRENMGKTYYYYGDSDRISYQCSPRGVSINSSQEITWTKLVKRINELIPAVDEQKKAASVKPEKTVQDTEEKREEITQLLCDEDTDETDGEPEVVDNDIVFHIDLECVTVKLPCAVGKTVFFRDNDKVKSGIVDLITFGEGMKPNFRVYDDQGEWSHFETADFGELLFYTYKDAERGSCN